MKRLKLFFACLLMAVLSIGQVWAAEQVAYTLAPATGSNNSYAGNCDVTISGITWNVTGNAQQVPWRIGGKSLSGVDRAVYSKTAMSDAITKVELTVGAASSITVNSLKLVVASNSDFSTVIDEVTGTFAANSTITFTPTSPATEWSTGAYYKFIFNVSVSGTSNKFVVFTEAKFYKEVATATCETPTFSPAAGTFYGSQEITLATGTDGASIYYTTDGTTPSSTNGTLYEDPFEITATTTIKAIAVKDGANDSEIAEAIYTAGATITSYDIDFEANNLAAYVNWNFSNIAIVSTAITAHGGTYYGNTDGKASASITTKAKYANPGLLTFYTSKESGNTTASSWIAQVSEDGEVWTEVATFDATTGSKGTWTEREADLSGYADVYVRIAYSGSTAIRAIDNISLATASEVAKPAISGDESFLTSTEVEITCSTGGVTIYYTNDGTDPKTSDTKQTYSDPFSINETTTIRAIANLGAAWSAEATSKTFTKITPITVAAAIAAIPNKDDVVNDQYVSGIVCTAGASVSSGKMTYYISDDGSETNRLQIYKGKNVGNTNFTAATDLAIGDRVVVFGQLKNYNNTPEMNDGNYLVSKEGPAVAAPVFSPNGGGFMGETDVTITCETEGSAIYYTLDGTTPSKSSTPYTAAIHLNATTTITAVAYVGDDASLVIAKTFTLTAPMTVAEALAALESENPINNVAVAGIISTAPTANPSSGKLTYFISDDGSASDELEVYKGFGVAGASFSDKTDLQVGDEVTVFGNLTIYNTTKEFAEGSRLIAFNRPVVPSISANPVAVDAAAHAAQSVTITYENWGTVNVADADATLFDDADCTIAFSGEWINNVSLEAPYSSVSFDIAANTGAARTAYMKIYALGDDANTEAEKVIAISQEEYVAPAEPATLPFAFDGGKSDITTTQGMSQEGLDSDYGSSPKLKFNTTGDYVIINIASDPGKLTYDIIGNGFSGGTFTVQQSANGTDYTDVVAYTELGAKASEEKTLAQTTRFVKFIYTEKSSGNVALGNIAIAEYVAPAAVETPEISGEESFLNSTTVTLSCETDGAIIYYTIDGTDPTNESTEYTAEFSLTETATVKAIAIKGSDVSGVAEKEFTKIEALATMDAIFAAATTAGSTATDVYVSFNNWVVSGIKGSNAFVTDGTKGFVIYASSHGFAVGNILSGTVACKVQLYKGAAELTNLTSSTTGLTVTTGGTVTATTKTIDQLGAINTGALVTIETLSYTETNLSDGANTIKPYNGLYSGMSFEDGKDYNVTGVVNYYDVLQIMPRSAADIEEIVDASAPETPTFSPAGGEYTEAQNVTISCATEGAAVYYTTDGSAPDNTKTLYNGVISVGETMTIKAIAIKDDKSSAVATAIYTINIPEDESNSKTWDLSKASYDANPTEDQVTWSATYVSMVANKATSTTAANNYLGGDANNRTSSRFYKNSTLTITPNGKEITSVVFTATSESYATALGNSSWTNASASASGSTVTVTPTDGKNAISATIGGTCGFTAVQVNYKNIAPETPDYGSYERNGLTAGNYGTICLPKAGAISGAKLFEVAYRGENIIYCDEILTGEMEAGVPYIFQATSNQLSVTYSNDNDPIAATHVNGLYGFYDLTDMATDDAAQLDLDEDQGNYILYQNAYWLVSGRAAYINNFRAYIKLGEISTTAPDPTPGAAPRRRVAMTVNGAQNATGMENVQGDNVQCTKVLIDGQMYILRGEKLFDATGRLVK